MPELARVNFSSRSQHFSIWMKSFSRKQFLSWSKNDFLSNKSCQFYFVLGKIPGQERLGLIKYARLGGHSQFVNDPPLIIIIEIVQCAVHNQIPPMHTRSVASQAFNPLLVNPIQYARVVWTQH